MARISNKFIIGSNTAGQVLTSNGSGVPPTFQTPGSAIILTAYISDEKSAGTDGGTFTGGSWQTRDLNTLVDPSSIVSSVSSNQFILDAGTYEIEAKCPAFAVEQHKAKLYNITDSTDALIGSSEYSGSNQTFTTNSTSSFIKGIIIISGTKTFEIQHQSLGTKATNGLGIASNFAVVEVYTQIMITKLS